MQLLSGLKLNSIKLYMMLIRGFLLVKNKLGDLDQWEKWVISLVPVACQKLPTFLIKHALNIFILFLDNLIIMPYNYEQKKSKLFHELIDTALSTTLLADFPWTQLDTQHFC